MATRFVPATKEYQVLKRNTGRLQEAITDPKLLSIYLLSVDLISRSTLQKVNVPVTTPDAQSYVLIDNLLRAVVIDPDNFHKLIEVLENHPPLLTAVAKEIKEDYESFEFEFTDLPEKQTEISRDQQKEIVIADGRSIQRGYDRMRGKLAGLVLRFQKVVEKANVSFEDLKQYIIFYHPHEQYRDELRKARDIYEVFDVIRSKFCSLFNYDVLLRIAENFNLPDGFKVIQEYEAEEDNYRKLLSSSTLASELQRENELLRQNLSCTKRIILRLQRWARPPAPTVAEFQEVIKEVFADLGDLLHLLEVGPGSIIVTMIAPERVIGALIALAKKSIAYLRDIGVTWLTIGDTLIINDIYNTEELSQAAIEQDMCRLFSSSPNKVENILDNVDNLPSSSVGAVTGIVSQLSRPLVQAGVDDGGDDTDQGMGTDSATPMADQTWRDYPVTPKEVVIIGSFGDHNNWLEQQYIVSPKKPTSKLSDEWRKEENKKIADLYSQNPDEYHIKSVHYDLPGSERTKEYYMEAIKQLFINCKQERGAVLYYTGHGEKDTGNWCFKDGVISFNDIFELYINHFKGKSLSITSDCSYSGNWINECCKRLDEMNVPSCGHHTREQGLLFQIFTSCQPNEEATALCFVNEAVLYSEADKAVLFWPNKTLSSGQKTMNTDFKRIYCSKPANESCEADADCTWNNRLKRHLIRLVCGEDKGGTAWHYLLLDKEKVADFNAKLIGRSKDIANYGRVLESGWGKDPPKYIEQKMDLRYGFVPKTN